jgi:hypothetical protein
MDNVQFDEEKVNNQFFRKSQTYRGLIGLVIKAKLAQNEVQANLVLMVVTVLCIAGVIFVLIGGTLSGGKSATKQVIKTQAEILGQMNK